MHKDRESKTRGTTPFGVRIPDWMLHEFEAARKRYRPDLAHRQDAVIEAMRDWTEAQKRKAAA